MACFSFDISACLKCVYEETKFIPCAYWNKKKLKKEMGRLEGMRRDVTTIIEQQERTNLGTKCKVVVRRWLDRVNDKETEVNDLLDSIQRRSGCTCCFASYNGKKLLDLIDDVHSLAEEGRDYVDDKILIDPVPVNHKNNLERKLEELKRMQEVVIKIISRQEREQPGTECKIAVRSWLDAVNRKDEEVNAILHPVSAEETFNGADVNVADLIDYIQSLVEEGKNYTDDKELIQPITVNPIDNVPDLATPLVGRNLKLLEIHGCIKDSQVNTIGIWGAGGIGKTALLKSIKDGLSKHHDFFYIVWIELSSQNTVDILDIQKPIAECISLSFQSEDETGRAKELRNVLRHKKTLVLIDNVWNELDFERIGIPFSIGNDLLKIVFTTRFKIVCTDMRAQNIVQLDCLDKEESFQLFQNNINVDIKNHNIRQRVDRILEKCGGLPLAILTVARTVANYTRVEEWDDAVDCLQNSPEDIEGMDDVMRCLKFSFDKLENDEIRSCLLYFSLYPQGKNIYIEELIRYWIGEGFLGIADKNSFRKSYARGHVFINKLKSFCLVESGLSDDRVKVHDVIRKMLRWICKNERNKVFLVYDKYQDVISNDYKDWHLVKGMYLNERQLIKCTLPEEGMPPNLTSVIVQANPSHPIGKLPTEDFFLFTPSLRVLDLSFIGLVELPKSIGELGELRHLNLNRTFIKMLPVELGNLKKLECLDLGRTWELEIIPNVAISQLSMLQSLNISKTGYQWNSDISMPVLMLDDLKELKNLEDLGVDVSSNSHLNTILGNQMLLNSITRIRFCKIDFVEEDLQPIKVISERFPPLKELFVDQCVLLDNVLEIKDDHQLVIENLFLWTLEISSVVIVKDCCPFHSLEYLQIFNCRCLKEVSWTSHIPSLQWLRVENCNGVEELVETGEEEYKCYFPKLKELYMSNMVNLQSIYGRNRPLLFPSLKKLYIGKCPQLKGLSLGHDSAKGIEMIKCTQSQWDSLEWEDDQVRKRFLPYLRVPLQ